MAETLTVYIVDDDPAVRDSLKWLIESLRYPVETFESAQDFLDICTEDVQGCLVLDVRLPGMSGLQLQKKLIDNGIELPIIVITGHGDVPMAVRAMKGGALHFLEKPFRDQEVLDCVQEALELASVRRASRIRKEEIRNRMGLLTPREYQIMKDIVKGSTNKIIGQTYDISIKTVEVHRTRVMHKMGADSLPELVKMVLAVEPDS